LFAEKTTSQTPSSCATAAPVDTMPALTTATADANTMARFIEPMNSSSFGWDRN
jgi:hypothetical protein